MKKVLALLVSIIMCASLFVPVSFADGFSDVGADNTYYEAINYLASMGIINGFEDGTFKPGESVTRAQFAKIMAFALGHKDLVASNQVFTDVPVDHWAAGNIEAMVSLGIINGMGDGTFAPENPVTYEQAVKMTVCALGYDAVAQNNGGYPDGYLKVATQRGFIKGIVDGVVGQGANRGLIAKLVDNMLGIDQLDPVTGEVKKDSSVKKDSYASESAKGQVIATYKAGLTQELEEECKKNEIIIKEGNEEVTYTIDGLSASVQAKISSYLGKLVTVNYKDDEESEYSLTSLVEQKGKNETLTLNAEDIYDFDGETIEYYDEKADDFEDVNIANDYYVIYNGKTTEKTLSEIMTALMAGDGTIELLSSDADGSYDVLFIKSYVTFVASSSPSTSTSDDKKVVVYNKDNTSQKWELPKETGNRGTVSYKLNGSTGTYSSITANSIVSIAASDDNTVFDVLVSTNKKSNANVNSLTTDEMTIVLDGTEYKMSNLFKTFIENNPTLVYAGAKGEFTLDAFGKVAGMKAAVATYTYGYLTAIETSSSSRADEPLLMNIYAIGSGSTMQAQTYAFKDSFYVNGVKYKTSESEDIETVKAILEADAAAFIEQTTIDDETVDVMKGTSIETKNHNESQPVEFSLSGMTDSGYRAIDKLFTHSGASLNDTGAVTTALVRNSKSDDIISSGSMSAGSTRTLGGYVINSTTKIIVVPQDKVTGTYYNRSYSSLGTGTTHYFQVFDATSTNVAGLLIIYTSPTTNVASLTHSNAPYVVSSVISEKTINGEETEAISFTSGVNGTKTEYYKADETKVYTVKLQGSSYVKDEEVSFDSLAIGDIVRFIANDDNTLAEVEIVLKGDDVKLHKRGIDTNSGTTNAYWNGVPYSTFTGTAKTWDMDTNTLTVEHAFVDDGTLEIVDEETWTVGSDVKVYVFDSAQSDNDRKFLETSREEIIDFDSVPDAASKIFGFRQHGTVKFIVIFR